MIELKNVSTNKFIQEQKQIWGNIHWYAEELLKKHNIRDYQQLKDFLDSNHSDLEFEGIINYLNSELKRVEKTIHRANELGVEPQIFTFDSYQSEEIDDKVINITDERNKGKLLLTANPLILHSGIESLQKLSIAEIKHCLSHLDRSKLKTEILEIPSIGQKRLQGVVNAVKFYDQQVLRQYFETEKRDINLFFLNKTYKKEIVELQLKEIAEYIVDNADECIWGKLSDNQKRIIMSTALNNTGQKIKGSFVNAISNYTTLSELENGILKEQEIPTVIDGVITRERRKPIDRFIVR